MTFERNVETIHDCLVRIQKLVTKFSKFILSEFWFLHAVS